MTAGGVLGVCVTPVIADVSSRPSLFAHQKPPEDTTLLVSNQPAALGNGA